MGVRPVRPHRAPDFWGPKMFDVHIIKKGFHPNWQRRLVLNWCSLNEKSLRDRLRSKRVTFIIFSCLFCPDYWPACNQNGLIIQEKKDRPMIQILDYAFDWHWIKLRQATMKMFCIHKKQYMYTCWDSFACSKLLRFQKDFPSFLVFKTKIVWMY
jgi:hypothetical protein